MTDYARRVFMVLSFDGGPHCGGIFPIEIGGGGTTIDPPAKQVFRCCDDDERFYSLVRGDMVGSDICLMASYEHTLHVDVFSESANKTMRLRTKQMCQLGPCLYNIDTNEVRELPKPLAEKPFPIVIAVADCFYALSTDTMSNAFPIESPSFERFDRQQWAWVSDSLPEYRVPQKSSMYVGGYSVINNSIIVISLSRCTPKFYFYNVTSSIKKWQLVPEVHGPIYAPPPLEGKSEFVDGFIYSLEDTHLLVAIPVTLSSDDDDCATVQSLGRPFILASLTFPGGCRLFDDTRLSYFEAMHLHDDTCDYISAMVYLGERVFCVAMTEIFESDYEEPLKTQNFTITTLRVSDPSTKPTILSQHVFPLSLGDFCNVISVSLFADPRNFEDWEEYFKNLPPVNTDSPKLESKGNQLATLNEAESVDSFLQQIGLQKYSTTFKDQEIDMAILVHMTDEDLTSIGLPLGPRKKILLALQGGFP